MNSDEDFMRLALRLARRGYGRTSPNPMVGAVVVRAGKAIGQGWHRKAGQAHAEIEAIRDAERNKHKLSGATLYVTLEPCCTHGRTPPCTDAIVRAGIKRVVVGAIDPNPVHEGKGVGILERAGIKVETGVLGDEATAMNEAFNHWIVHRTPLVTVKAAMTLDGKIATANAESKWITGEKARAEGMKMRRGADAILVGVNTILADNPSLTVRSATGKADDRTRSLRRIILDSQGRTPLMAQVVADEWAANTAIVVSRKAKSSALKALGEKVQVWVAPENKGQIDLRWLLKKLGAENVTSLLVEGGGEVNASFLLAGMAHRVAFFYALKVIGGDEAIKAVGGDGLSGASEWLRLRDVEWKNMGADLMLRARTGQ